MAGMKSLAGRSASGRSALAAVLWATAILACGRTELRAQVAGTTHRATAASPSVVLIAMSGLRWDDPQRAPAPHLLALAKQGTWAPQGMLPVFPAESAPNLFTIATGLYPGHHGIVADVFWDPGRQARYLASERRSAAEAHWYAGTPLWSLAEKQGIRTACIGWTGCAAEIAGARPTYDVAAEDVPADRALRQALDWLRLPPERRPRLITVAVDEPGRQAREFGPDAPQTLAAVRRLDAAIGKFQAELHATRLPVDLVIVSDRGFAKPQGEWITLARYAPLQAFQTEGVLLYGKTEHDRVQAYDQLKKATSEFIAYRLKDFPADLHMNGNPRLGDPVVVATGAYAFRATAASRTEPRAVDGFNPAVVPEMKAVFIASGPDIVAGSTVGPFENVNLYGWVAHLLGLTAPKNDGNLNILSGTLRDDGGPEN